jgi:outer membrane lipoprotein carrier protein
MSPLFFLLALLHPHVAKAPAPLTADQLVAKVQAYYAGTKKLSANFRQEYTNTTFGRSSTSDGRVYVAKPGKMRWDYTKPEKKYFISDGTTLWVYEEASKQAIQQSLQDQILPVAVTFLYGKGDLAAEFGATLDPGKYGGAGDLCVKLTPKKPEAQYKNLWLVVDPADFHVKESVILEASDNVNHFTFLGVEQNERAKVEDKHFLFVPPPGVKVVKGEELGKDAKLPR